MKIKSVFKEYSVAFCRDLSLLQDLAAAKDTFFVLDRTVYEIYKDRLPDLPKERFLLLEAVEEKKDMAAMLAICERMTEMSAKRNSHLVSLGGASRRTSRALSPRRSIAAFAGRSSRRRSSPPATAASAASRH